MSSVVQRAAAKAAERLRLMRAERASVLSLFQTTMKQVLAEKEFSQGDSMVDDIAESVAKKMGVKDPAFEVKTLHNHWRSVGFVYTSTKKMEPPAKKGMVVDPDVITKTRFLVSSKSVFIEASYMEMDEEGNETGSEQVVCTERRPNQGGAGESSGSTF